MLPRPADARSALADLVGRPVEAAEVSHRVGGALQHAVAFDGWCLFGLDPLSGLRTFQLGGRGTERTAEMARNEALMPDVNKYDDLACAAVPAAWLSREHPEARTSFRLHEIMKPQGFHSEIRVALRDQGRLWGALVLYREDPNRLYDDADVARVHAVADPLTRLVRTHPVRPLPRRGQAPGAGIVTLSPDDRLLTVSPAAQAWLDSLVPGGEDQTYATDVTRVLFDAARAVRHCDARGTSTRIRTVTGHWLSIQAVPLPLGEADVAVVLQPAAVHQLLGTLATCAGLTARESQVLGLLAEGLASKQIARELGLSLLTVNGHLNALYTKCGTSGREELLARLA